MKNNSKKTKKTIKKQARQFNNQKHTYQTMSTNINRSIPLFCMVIKPTDNKPVLITIVNTDKFRAIHLQITTKQQAIH